MNYSLVYLHIPKTTQITIPGDLKEDSHYYVSMQVAYDKSYPIHVYPLKS